MQLCLVLCMLIFEVLDYRYIKLLCAIFHIISQRIEPLTLCKEMQYYKSMKFSKKISDCFKKHYLISLVILYIGIFTIWLIIGFIWYGLLSGLITSALIIIIAKITGYINVFGFRKRNIQEGLILGFPAIFAGVYTLFISFAYIRHIGFFGPNYDIAGKTAIYILGTGLFEELFMRGIILNILIINCKKNKLFSIIIAASISGISHLVNLINRTEYIIAIISQMSYTIVMGIFFSVIYLKYGNIWSIIIIHILFNLMGLIPFALFSHHEFFYMLHSEKIIAVIDQLIAIPYLVYSFYLYKNIEKMENST